MAKQYPSLENAHSEFIAKQKMFFVGTARETGRVNISPKGMDTLRVANSNKIVWLNLTGSGNETAAHLIENPRMTIMFCAFEGKPLILRLYGQAKIYHEGDTVYEEYISLFGETKGARQVIVLDVDLVQTSCGYAVPFMDFKEERIILRKWAEKKDKEQLEAYWKEKNSKSIDGFLTDISS